MTGDSKQEMTKEEKTKAKKIKCFHCKKKCTLINFPCECGKTFCQMHRYPHSHDCKSCAKKEQVIKTLETNNPKMESVKIEAI